MPKHFVVSNEVFASLPKTVAKSSAKGKIMILGGRHHVEGVDFNISSSHSSKICKCQGCGEYQKLYAKGLCKNCYELKKRQEKELSSEELQKALEKKKNRDERNRVRSEMVFRKQWPHNLFCALDKTKYVQATYPYTDSDTETVLSIISSVLDEKAQNCLLRHYKNRESVEEIAFDMGMARQSLHAYMSSALKNVKACYQFSKVRKGDDA